MPFRGTTDVLTTRCVVYSLKPPPTGSLLLNLLSKKIMSKSSFAICRHCGKPIECVDGYLLYDHVHSVVGGNSFSFCDMGDIHNLNRATPKTKDDYINDFIKCLK